ncbi:glycosyltransferase family 4 protein [Gluconobacter cerevisiae]|uniref:Glycosyltransferase family 4 protein n=1 Tax=Gluconobacter cerevisiae TaxID=1379734 RepID=A0ABR9YBE7_9PROT|nr:glycosyltransferase family 4 protein [Gluconobacter cerevisiae]MBF0875872.1 glycosyltransferase family 4 protein [Gluconobacter cerevisiae]
MSNNRGSFKLQQNVSQNEYDTIHARILTILPPRERYEAGHAGAISLLVDRLADAGDIVAGSGAVGVALPGGRYRALTIPRIPLSCGWRFRLSCVAMMRSSRPALTEVHNRPDLARFLARFGPVRLVLHNDPCTMRGARSVRQREDLARHVLVCGVSDWVIQRFREGCGPIRTEIQPNCLDLSALPVPREREKTVLFAGRVVADKGVDAFVRAWSNIRASHPGWRAVIMGADRFGPDSPETPYLKQLRPLAAAAGVMMTGYRPHDAVLDAMAEAAIVVVPSRWQEPFGMTALEAMGCGAAVVASPEGALSDLVGDAALLAAPDEPGALEQALGRLMKDDGLREKLGAQGRERAVRFDVGIARTRVQELRQTAIAFVKHMPQS